MGLFFLNPLSGVCSFIKLQERAKTRAATLSFFPSVYLVAPLRANAQTALLHEPGTTQRSSALPNPLSGICSLLKLHERAKNPLHPASLANNLLLQHLARECTTSPSHTLMSFQSYNTFPVP